MKIKILVSGIGGDIGFGVGRILRSLDFVTQVFGIDIHDNHPGSTLFDKCAVCPKASNDDYLSWLNSFILNNKVDFFIPSSEAEIKALTDLGKEEIAGAKVLMSNKFMVEKCLDKNQCLRFLKSKDIQVPLNGLVGIDTPDDYPVIVKPNYGRGSQGLKKIESNTMVLFQNFDCSVYARADYILDKSGVPYFLEMNTLPGMTSTSLVPKSAYARGQSFRKLISSIIELSL